MECSYFNNRQCRSCNLLDVDYETTLQRKSGEIEKLFSHKPKVVATPKDFHFRYRAKLAVGLKNSKYQFGFSLPDGSITDISECLIHHPLVLRIVKKLKELLPLYKIIPYDIATKKGELKYVLINVAYETDESMIRFVLRSKESLDRIRLMTNEKFKEYKVVSVNLQPEHKAIIEGDEEILLSQHETILHSMGKIKIHQGVKSFFQTNPSVAHLLYQEATQKVIERKTENLLDLYCGVGGFALFSSPNCKSVTAMEISSEAILSAKKSAEENQFTNVNFVTGDATNFFDQSTTHFDTILVNPPRRGLGKHLSTMILTHTPKTIIYSSCDALSLKVDLEIIKQSYQIESITLFDMFPYTDHFETLMVLVKS